MVSSDCAKLKGISEGRVKVVVPHGKIYVIHKYAAVVSRGTGLLTTHPMGECLSTAATNGMLGRGKLKA